MKHNIIIHGLFPLKKDERDYSLAGFFDQIKVEDLPNDDFIVATPLKIKDQGPTDYCSAYATTSVSEDQEGVELLPEYQFFRTKQIMGNVDDWGADLRSACKAIVDYGSLETSKSPINPQEATREQIVKVETWPSYCYGQALLHKKNTYFAVDGRYDTFDNIRTALYQHKDEKRSIVVGAQWKQQWTDSVGGVIPESEFAGGFGHAFKIYGWKMFNGVPHLCAQLSNSENIGDKGIFYFPRSVVNREITPYGQFMFKDVQKEAVEATMKQVEIPLYTSIIKSIINFFKLNN